jgi:hypothetical protein
MQFKRPFWVRFDVEDRSLPAPDFCLPEPGGDAQICRSDFRGRCSLAVYFSPVHQSSSYNDALERIGSQAEAYQSEGAQVLAVFPSEEDASNGAAWMESTPGAAVLIDRDGSARTAYAGLMVEELTTESDGLLFVLDEFGAPYAVLVGAEKAGESLNDEVLSWLQFIDLQCPE